MATELIMAIKAGGAAMGSTIAVVFMPGHDTPLILFKRLVIGTILGFISAPAVIDFFGWERTWDYWLAAATLGGLLGYLGLQLLFSPEAKTGIQSVFVRGKR